MAFWKREAHGVVVFYSREGRQRRVPRREVSHLDGESDSVVAAWVRNWELTHEALEKQTVILTHDASIELVKRFCTYLATRNKSPRTVAQHRQNLINHCLPFLVQQEKLTSPAEWPSKSVRLFDHLRGEGIGSRTIATCNVSLRVFWRWLGEESLAPRTPLPLRNPATDSRSLKTPLVFTVPPWFITGHAYATPELRLMALLSFCFSLRPQEVVALRPRDFRAGSAAQQLAACQVMGTAGLYSRLAVHVGRQRAGNEYVRAKAGSEGWVACFYAPAARAVVELLRGRDPDALLFGYRLDWWYRVWKKGGYPGLTLKDMRRASLYFLGHHTQLPFSALQRHARHSDPATTAIYTRRPGEEAPAFEELDLDA